MEPDRLELPDASNLSDAARELMRRRLAGDREVTSANRPLYRELVAARIMYPVSTWVGGPESVFRFTRAGWERGVDLIDIFSQILGHRSSQPRGEVVAGARVTETTRLSESRCLKFRADSVRADPHSAW
jgi:hypothetical protein